MIGMHSYVDMLSLLSCYLISFELVIIITNFMFVQMQVYENGCGNH
jgi:hypothetical protein